MFEVNYFDDKTQAIINKTEVPLGIFVDKDLTKTENISVILFNNEDQFLLDYVKLLKKNSQAKISIFDTYDIVNENINDYVNGDYVWVGFEGREWNVYRYTPYQASVANATYTPGTTTLTIEMDRIVDLTLSYHKSKQFIVLR